jgi:hypothetical protein
LYSNAFISRDRHSYKKGQGNVENVTRIYVKKGNEAREKLRDRRKETEKREGSETDSSLLREAAEPNPPILPPKWRRLYPASPAPIIAKVEGWRIPTGPTRFHCVRNPKKTKKTC